MPKGRSTLRKAAEPRPRPVRVEIIPGNDFVAKARMPRDMYDKACAVAKEKHHTFSSFLRSLLDREIQQAAADRE